MHLEEARTGGAHALPAMYVKRGGLASFPLRTCLCPALLCQRAVRHVRPPNTPGSLAGLCSMTGLQRVRVSGMMMGGNKKKRPKGFVLPGHEGGMLDARGEKVLPTGGQLATGARSMRSTRPDPRASDRFGMTCPSTCHRGLCPVTEGSLPRQPRLPVYSFVAPCQSTRMLVPTALLCVGNEIWSKPFQAPV